ncbi:glycosyltransferase family 2 protein [candidate division KSB1 bacterium]|nr:glycosyltransferase family 2 protein [candidate division KSB1 bacterium]
MNYFCSVIVPNYNGSDLLPKLIASLEEQSGLDLEIIIVDNGSTDLSKEVVPKTVRWIQLDRNYGFAYAVNRGFEAAMHPYIFIVNSDMVLEPDCLTHLISFLDAHKEYGFAQPKVRFLDRKDTINTVGDVWSVYGLAIQKGFGQEDKGQFDQGREIFSPTGGAAVFRKSMLDEVGLFDERFISYLEDVDLGFRIRTAGFRGVLVPEAVIYHAFQATFRKVPNLSRFYVTRNNYFVIIKNMPFLLLAKYLPQLLIGLLRILIVSVKDRCLPVLLKVQFSILKHLFSLIKERRRIQRRRQITARELDGWFTKERPFPILFWKKAHRP